MTSRLLTLDEAAAYLAIPKAAVKRIPVHPVNVGGRLRWDRVALDAWLDKAAGLIVPPSTDAITSDDPFDQWAKAVLDDART